MSANVDLWIGFATIGAIAVAAFLLFSAHKRKKGEADAQRMAVRAMAVWSRYGPFESGEQSAIFFLASWMATGGVRRKFAADTIQKHASAYNSSPAEWRKIIDQSKTVPIDERDLLTVERLISDPVAMQAELRSWN